MLTLILTWLYFHFRFINVPPLHIENRLKEMEKKKNYDFFVNDRIGMAILKAKNQMSLLQKDSDSLGWFDRFMLKIRKKAILWNSVLIGCGLVLVEAMILAHGILKELEDDYIDNKPALYMSFWMFILIPYFMFSGIGIISTDSSCGIGCVFNSPVFAVALTVIMSFVREEYLDDEEFEWLRNFLVNAPLLSLMFWTTLKLFGTYDRDLMWYAASFFSICFFVPLYYIAPFRNYAWFGKGTEDNWFGDYGEVSDLLYDGL